MNSGAGARRARRSIRVFSSFKPRARARQGEGARPDFGAPLSLKRRAERVRGLGLFRAPDLSGGERLRLDQAVLFATIILVTIGVRR